jgi:hypothetical protein
MESTASSTGQVAWEISEFSKLAKVTRQHLHNLPAAYQPESVRVGRRRLILESPESWLRRIQAMGGAPSRRVAA